MPAFESNPRIHPRFTVGLESDEAGPHLVQVGFVRFCPRVRTSEGTTIEESCLHELARCGAHLPLEPHYMPEERLGTCGVAPAQRRDAC